MFGRKGRRIPLVVVLREELNGLKTHGSGGADRSITTARD
jgi:hypothetical protein